MFNTIPAAVLKQMKVLEEIDAKDRQDGTPKIKRLRQVPPDSGKVLAFLAAGVPKGAWLEIGTSAGYSALWLSLAARQRGAKLITFELLPDKVKLAKDTFKKAAVGDVVELVHGDARGHIRDYAEVSFCFLDCEKEMYLDFFELITPNLIPGALLVADNAINHADNIQVMLDKAFADPSLDSVIIPVGKGLLACRKN
ncbi:MAG: class I SAM-dependent methyltransferase [Chloroflexota bacterium]